MIPILNFQGTVVMLDDDSSFLDTEYDYLRKKGHRVEKFLSASEAVNYCEKSTTLKDLMPVSRVLEEEIEGSATEIRVRQIVNIHNSNFKKKVTPVIIADYEMPEMDGISFFRKLNQSQSYKILLTGVAEESVAINAFNEGLIDYYITKNGIDLFDKLNNVVQIGTKKYFERESAQYIDLITKDEPDSLLNIEECTHFNKYIFGEKVSEFYLLDSLGSYFLVDNTKEKILVVSTEDKSEAMGDLCGENRFVSKEDVEEVKKGRKIVCTNRRISCNENLSMHLKEAKTAKVRNRNIFYYYGDNMCANGSRLIQLD